MGSLTSPVRRLGATPDPAVLRPKREPQSPLEACQCIQAAPMGGSRQIQCVIDIDLHMKGYSETSLHFVSLLVGRRP
jgi:hypothetical protein